MIVMKMGNYDQFNSIICNTKFCKVIQSNRSFVMHSARIYYHPLVITQMSDYALTSTRAKQGYFDLSNCGKLKINGHE